MNHNHRNVHHNRSLQAAICKACLLGLFAVSFAFSQEAAPNSTDDTATAKKKALELELAAIRAESLAFAAAFNKRDAKAIAELWTQDGEYIDDLGRRFLGRDAIEQGYTAFFANSPKVTLRVTIDSIRLLSDNTAI